MNNNFLKILFITSIGLTSLSYFSHAHGNDTHYYKDPPPDSLSVEQQTEPTESTSTEPGKGGDTLKIYNDRFGDPINNPNPYSPYVVEPEDIKTDVILSDDMDGYIIKETTEDGLEVRPPTKMSPEDFAEYKREQLLKQYQRELSKTELDKKRGAGTPPVPEEPKKKEPLVSIVPSGNVSISFGGRWQRTKNPAVPVNLQRTGGFDFDQQIQLNLLGSIGDRLKVSANYNTKAQFDFDNNLKVAYDTKGKEESWLRDIQLGTINVPLNTQLIRGAQKLTGVKTVMQFGKVGVTAFVSKQNGSTVTKTIKGGGQSRDFEFSIAEYDEYKHFFLGHYFRDIFEQAYKNNPTSPNNGFKINRVEVYVTNSASNTKNLKNIVAFSDLGEIKDRNITNTNIVNPLLDSNAVEYMSTNVNTISNFLYGDSTYRDPDNTISFFQNEGFELGVDFEKINSARALEEGNDFTFHPELGFISLKSKINKDEALAVSFEYTLNGITYQVGELSENYSSLDQDEVIALKLLKPSSVNLTLNTWDLMMKNIYSLNSRLTGTDFQLRLIYKDDITGLDNPSLQEGIKAKDQPLLQLFGLDKMNPNGDLIPDGNFDFIENATILTQRGHLIFPTPEPFGDYMNRTEVTTGTDLVENAFFDNTEGDLKAKYVFKSLYDNTRAQALRETVYNKFYIKGQFQNSTSASINLDGISIAEGSVTVKSGAVSLEEGRDYTVSAGRVNIINTGVFDSGNDIVIQYEKQDLFQFQTKSLIGTRVEYNHSKIFNFGTTFMRLAEAPVVTRVSVGDEPVNNTQLGADFSFSKDSRLITKMVDFLPAIQTKETSTITANWEVAAILPGNSRILGENGTSYIDDFEGAETPYNFGSNVTSWVISTPPKVLGNSFSDYEDYGKTDLSIGDHRGKLVWFNPDLSFYRSSGGTAGVGDIDFHNGNQFTRAIAITEIFQRKELTNNLNNATTTFDLHYYPRERGPYNYNVDPQEINSDDGFFTRPENNWAGVTRDITFDTDFEAANVEFIEFWMMDPFHSDLYDVFPEELDGVDSRELGGDLFFNLGDISEDVIKDSRHGFENGLPDNIDTTQFGIVTTETFILNAFDNEGNREEQDLGFDGLSDESERSNDFFGSYITALESFVDPNAEGLQRFQEDPSSDNYDHYINDFDESADEDNQRNLMERYKFYNGYENNSPIVNSQRSSTNLPENEDLNDNKTLDQVDRYFQYHLPFNQDVFDGTTNHKYVVDTNNINGTTYYQVRIPIKSPETTVGSITDFNTIKYFRMYMTGFEHPIAIRMINFQLVASQWVKYTGNDLIDGALTSDSRNEIDPYPNVYVSTVNIEENQNYQLPPGVIRDINQTSINNAQQNEQSLQICASDIKNGDGAAAYKNIAVDLINYKRLKMFIHGETDDITTESQEINAFLRLGTDITENYYEIAVPLEFSGSDAISSEDIWKAENEIDLAISELTQTKLERNEKGIDKRQKYSRTVGNYIVSVVGSPDRSTVRTAMVGIANPTETRDYKSACVWFNELRVTDFDKQAGWATVGNVDVQLADLGSVSGSMQYTSANYGDIESKIAERTRDKTLSYGAQTNIQLHKFGPEKIGLQLPLFASVDGQTVKPKYDPFDPDVTLNESLDEKTEEEQEEYKDVVQYKRVTKSINLTNVRKVKMKDNAKKHFFDIENITVNLGYKEETRKGAETNSTYGNAIASYIDQNYKGSANYSYNFKKISFTPFKKIKVKSKYFDLIKGINISPIPSSLTVQGLLDRRYFRSQLYNGNFKLDGSSPSTEGVDPNYEKSFTFNRLYNLRWNLTKNLNLTYTANADALVDEPNGNRFGEVGLSRSQYNSIVWQNLSKLGRIKSYTQDYNITYKIPIDKIPLFSWIRADAKYKVNYDWKASAFEAEASSLGEYKVPTMLTDANGDAFGNYMGNSRDITLNSKFTFTSLYKKSKYLKNVLTNRPTRKSPPKPKKKAKTEEGDEDDDKDEDPPKPKKELKLVKRGLKTLMMVQNLNLKYTLKQETDLPGMLSTPQALGLDFDNESNGEFAPGYSFLTGSQNLNVIKNKAIAGDWYTKSTFMNTALQQTKNENFTAKSKVQPFKNFTINFTASYKKTEGYQELLQFDDITNEYVTSNPVYGGNVEYSFIAIPSIFKRDGEDNVNQFFEQFENSRQYFSGKLNNEDEGSASYNLNNSDVLIPAFIAAYTGKEINSVNDVNSTNLRKTPKIPLPNWSINYSGLSKIPKLKKIFSSISLSHKYQSTIGINSFQSKATYSDIDYLTGLETQPDDLLEDSITGYYTPLIIVDELVISERFNPLIGVNLTTRSKFKFNFRYNKSRNLALDLNNTQVTEVRNNDFSISVGFTTKEPLKWFSGAIRNYSPLKNDLTVKMDMTIRDQITLQRILKDENGENGNQEVTTGSRNYQIRPNVSYQYNKKLNLQLYFERTVNEPKTSASYFRGTTAFGIRLRFSLV